MNQAIQFPDREFLDVTQAAICFPVLVNGLGLTCAIALTEIEQRFGEDDAMALFCHHRWDLEDEAENCIRQEQVDDQGWVWLTSVR